MIRFLPLLILVLLSSCGPKEEVPEGILKPAKMQDLFWDFTRAEVYSSYFAKRDSLRSEAIENLQLQEKIFKLHHVTKEEFYKSYTYYSNHKDLMTKMIDSIIARKKREKKDKQPLQKEIKKI